MLIWPQRHREPGIKFEPQDPAKHLVGFEARSFRFWTSALNHLSMTLAHKYVNLTKLYNQDIKELVTFKNISKKKNIGFTWNRQPHRHSEQKPFFKFNLIFAVLTLQVLSITQTSVNKRSIIIWSITLEPCNDCFSSVYPTIYRESSQI